MFYVGDEVKITYNIPGYYHQYQPDELLFAESMKEYFGEIDTISKADGDFSESSHWYKLTNNSWTWHEDWLTAVDADWIYSTPDLLELYK